MQLSLSCVSPNAQWYSGRPPLGREGQIAITTEPYPIPLKRGDSKTLYLAAAQSFHFERRKTPSFDMKVATDEYIYNVGRSPDSPRDYLFAWHWHPSFRPDCHLHAVAELDDDVSLHGKHLPTARIAFEDVLRFLLDEFGVDHARPDWDAVLTDTKNRHDRYKTWWGSSKPSD